MPRVYLASPLGFATSTKAFMEQLETVLTDIVEVANPWRFGTASDERPRIEAITDRAEYTKAIHDLNHRIAAANEQAIRNCEFLIAVLDGVDVDSGTASEIGFAYALNKRIWGIRTDFRLTGENTGAIVNLQVQYWIEASGGEIAHSIEDLLTSVRSTLSAND